MKPSGWAVTDVGRKRDHNEDSYLCSNDIGLYAVADGMGGHLGGERASRMAVEILETELFKLGIKTGDLTAASGQSPHPAAIALREATQRAARAIFQNAQSDIQYSGMGTTLTSMLFHGEHATLCHVGDSRVYLYRDGRARQLTEDHSWIQEQIRAGLLSPDDALVSRFRNIITRSVGFEAKVEPDVITFPVEAGDSFVLCSDGLSNYLSADEIGGILSGHFFKDAGQALVDTANERGGDDNITCIVIYLGNVA